MPEDIVRESINSYNRLLNFEYQFTFGRKGKLSTIVLKFKKDNFHHLAGLHYLKDRPILNGKSEKVFDKLVSGDIATELIANSAHFSKIQTRLHCVNQLESILDGDFYLFEYNQSRNLYSNIRADFVLKSITEDGEVFLFLAKDKILESNVFCCSIIGESRMDYTRNQIKTTVLVKTKTMLQ